jgi:membrane dipeptidase
LQRLINHIDHVCQLAGNAHHVGLGSDFDGGFGVQSVPLDIDTIADLQKLAPLLEERGYTDEDVAAILGGNWLDLLRDTLPES